MAASRNNLFRDRRALRALVLLLLTGLFLPVGTANATEPDVAVSATAHKPFTKTGADYWKWVLTQPAATNPLTDTTGAFCDQGQRGQVWFLAGSLGSEPITRTCTIPADKTLVFPVVNNLYAAFLSDPPEQRTEAFVRAQVAFVKADASDLKVTVDGRPLRSSRICYQESRLFSVTLPDGNLLGLPAGFVLSPSVDAGYYAHLAPLSPGRHTIRIQGALPQVGLSLDVSYKLIVKKGGSDY